MAAETVKVGVIMGSDSDLSTMRHAGVALTVDGLKFGHDYEDRVISAHRTPETMAEYAATAEERGLKAIIAGAGGSAHLPGMVASETKLPVLGVAITKRPQVMNRALGSLIGMPEGKPLATFQGENGAHYAGKLAARIVKLNPELRRVGVVMSSEEEFETMSHTARALMKLGFGHEVHFETRVLPTMHDVNRYGMSFRNQGVGVVVASSTKESTLAQDLRKLTDLPVIGVGISNDPDIMNPGISSLLNPPTGEAIGAFQATAGAFNAGLFAARIVGLRSPSVRESLQAYDEKLEQEVRAKDAVLERLGAEAYIGMKHDDPEGWQKLIDGEMEG